MNCSLADESYKKINNRVYRKENNRLNHLISNKIASRNFVLKFRSCVVDPLYNILIWVVQKDENRIGKNKNHVYQLHITQTLPRTTGLSVESDRVIALENQQLVIIILMWTPTSRFKFHQIVGIFRTNLYYQGTLGLVSRECISLDAAHAKRFQTLEVVGWNC